MTTLSNSAAAGAQRTAQTLNHALKPTVAQKAFDAIPILIKVAKGVFFFALLALTVYLSRHKLYQIMEASSLSQKEVNEFAQEYSDAVYKAKQYGQLTDGQASSYLSNLKNHRMREILLAMKKDEVLKRAYLWRAWSPKEFLESCQNVERYYS